LRRRSFLGLVLRTDEFQGGAEVLDERGVHLPRRLSVPVRHPLGE
jgi:hypothetical protein